jgi:hypothetical protein
MEQRLRLDVGGQVTTSAAVTAHRHDDVPIRGRLEQSTRRLAACSVAGAVLGLVVGGVGGRLAMLLLARLNPEVAGTVSDDGFVMGQFGLVDTANLLLVGFGLGVLGAAFYALLRGLMIGPLWFRRASISVGPAVVVGEMLVHTDGVDFTVLQPVELAIALFVLIPGLYALGLTVLAERWLRPGSWFQRAQVSRVAPCLLIWAVAFPALPALLALTLLWLGKQAAASTSWGSRLLSSPLGPWLARAALAVVFLLSAAALADDVAVLA